MKPHVTELPVQLKPHGIPSIDAPTAQPYITKSILTIPTNASDFELANDPKTR